MATTGPIDEWLAARRGPTRWRPDEAARVLEVWKRSGESLAEFSRRHGFSPQRLERWHDRLTPGKASATQTLIPMTVRAATKDPCAAAVSIVVDANGARIDVLDPARVPPLWFAAVMEALSKEGT